ADGLGDSDAKSECGKKVESSSPDHGPSRRKHARGNHGGDTVSGVVKAVDEVERKRDEDGNNDQQYAQVHLSSPVASLQTACASFCLGCILLLLQRARHALCLALGSCRSQAITAMTMRSSGPRLPKHWPRLQPCPWRSPGLHTILLA